VWQLQKKKGLHTVIEELKQLKKHFENQCNSDKIDEHIIGNLFQDMDVGQPWITSNNNYVWHYVVAQKFRPKNILEIGTRFGYSMKAMVDASGHNKEDYSLWSIDCDFDKLNCHGIVADYFAEYNFNHVNAFTLDCRSLRVTNEIDLAHIDANDTLEDTYHNCVLAIESLKDGGIMLVDDLDNPAVKKGVDKFCRDYGFDNYEVIPSLHTMAFIVNNDTWKNDIRCQFSDHDYPQKKYLTNTIKAGMAVLDVGGHQGEYGKLFDCLTDKLIVF